MQQRTSGKSDPLQEIRSGGLADSFWLSPSADFLSSLDADDRDALVASARRKTFRKGHRIFEAGDPASMLYILESGRAKVYQTSASGKDVILWFCFPGEIFGLAELSRGVERTISALAVDESEVLVLSKRDFLTLIGERPAVALTALDILSSRLRRLGETFMNLATEEVPVRLARLLLSLAHGGAKMRCSHHTSRGGICVNVTLTHQEIADMIGSSRQTVTTALNHLKRAGTIQWFDHHIHIERPADLAAAVGLPG